MGARLRAFDWTKHPLGTPAEWPQPLRTSVRLMLNTGHPIYIFWGPELYCFYNDAYSQSIGPERHPVSLGRPGRQVWDEIWGIIGPQIDQVMSGRGATWNENALVPITRNGQREEVYWTYSYGPIDDDAAPNGVGGVLVVCTETTKTVLAERTRATETAQQRRLFEQAPGFIIIMQGPEHRVDFVNDAHRSVFGSADWVGKTIRRAFPSIEGQGFFELLDKVYQTGETVEFNAQEVRYRRSPESAEETRYLTFIYAPLFSIDGKISGVFCEGFDVTPAHIAQAEMRNSEDRLRLATQAAQIGTWDFDPATGVLRWDERCKALFGLPADAEVTYDGAFLAGLHPDDREGVDAAVRAAIAPGSSGAYDIQYRTIGINDGVERWIAATGNAHFENGVATRFIGTVRDISDHKRAERRLEVTNKTGAAVAAELDLDKIVQMITDAGLELTGAEFGAFFYNVINQSGESYMLYALSGVEREAFSKFPMPRNTQVFAPTFSGEGVVRSDNIRKDPRYGHNAPRKGMPDGHLPVSSYLAIPVVSRSGEVHGGLFFGHKDEAVFKAEHELALLSLAGQAATAIDNARLVQALQGLNATLEHRVSDEVERRGKVEDQLRQAQKMEAIGQLTGGIAHDFNNMLAVVIGALNMMQRRIGRGETDVAKYVEAAMDGANRASSLTKRLLAFSRQQTLAPEQIDANQLVTGMTDLLRRTLGEQITIKPMLADDLGAVSADPSQLESSLLNLAVNARDAMPAGGTLTIETSNARFDDARARIAKIEPGDYVLIAVSDTGHGMDAETLGHVFEPFFTTKGVGQGTGLGLSQVFGFVSQSGGHVKIESAPEAGARVEIYLPRFYGPTQANKDATRAAPAPTGNAGECILVVEDEERVRNFTEEALKELGYSVVVASNGVDALQVLDAHPGVLLLLTDVIMPGMSGKQLAEEALAKRPDLKVIFSTGYARDVEVAAPILNSQESQLLKPFTIDQLAAKVRAAIDA